MAITNAQQARQLYKNGKRVGLRGGGADMGGTGSSTGSSGPAGGASSGGNYGGNSNTGGNNNGGNNNNNGGGNNNSYEDRIRREQREKKEREARQLKEKQRIEAEQAKKDKIAKQLAEKKRIEAEIARKEKIAAQLKEKKRLEAEQARKEKLAKEKLAKEKEEEEKKKAKELSDLGKNKTTKFGTVVGPTAKSTLDKFKANRYFDERLGYVDEFGNPIGNTLNATLASLSTPTKTTDGITSVVGGDITDDIREQYGVLRSTTPKDKEVNISDALTGALDRPLDKSSDLQTAINDLQTGRYNADLDDLMPGDEFTPKLDVDLNKREKALQEFLDRRNEVKTFGLSSLFKGPLQKFSDFNASKNRKFFEDVIRAGKIPNLSFDSDLEKEYQSYMADRLAGKTDAYGNPLSGYSRDASGNIIGTGNDGGNNQPPIVETVKEETEEEEVNPRDYTGLGARFMGSQFDFSGLADGGRAGYMDGGMPEYQGGIMDLETGRQQYFLGKLVKKATRAIKKVAKSPIGKAALLYFGGNALMGGGAGKGLGSFFGKGSFNPLKALITKGPQTGMIGSSGLGKIFGNLGLAKEGALTLGGKIGLGFGVPLALEMLGVGKQKDEEMDLGPGIDINAIRNSPYRYLAPRFTGSKYEFADGGRIGYAEGSKEPVAKETMPLLDMDGMEKDYREDGGFVPIGRMERADDVPARLSKNEFVFTADAVRNAGEGDIDKGAEVMYNMMKNLESGGEVSEESQGLDGAREMFQTSQRLEEVL